MFGQKIIVLLNSSDNNNKRYTIYCTLTCCSFQFLLVPYIIYYFFLLCFLKIYYYTMQYKFYLLNFDNQNSYMCQRNNISLFFNRVRCQSTRMRHESFKQQAAAMLSIKKQQLKQLKYVFVNMSSANPRKCGFNVRNNVLD